MLGIPTLVHVLFVWVPTLGSIVLSFSSWDGIGGFEDIEWIGVENYVEIFTEYPRFWPAVQHNLIWLVFLLVVPTVAGLFFAVLLDRQLRFTKVYQSALFMPVVLSLALVGFIWQLIYRPDDGLLNSLLGLEGKPIDWLGDTDINLYAVLVAAAWRHTGYIMILYLAGLKSVDPALKEAAALDGANSWQTFFRVTFPVMKPVNIVVLVVTVIEALRAFDIVYVINKGRNGLELLSVLVTDNIIGEASRIGRGSAVAVVLLTISLGTIITFLYQTFSKESRS
ncbi:sugar ABC transporter permease [Lentzea tibetensis]|uniref:Sugar ABC transporter permease n=2 Tax=Lentzea tibetensis TaxID=2591470 RepID=A0A563ER23_9PSEU|nr:sugar ABC transporter permease [Lentzea tibetensis]